MIDQLDLKSDEFTKADVTREDVLAAIAKAGTDGVADFSGKRLNGLDLSGLDLRRLKLQADPHQRRQIRRRQPRWRGSRSGLGAQFGFHQRDF